MDTPQSSNAVLMLPGGLVRRAAIWTSPTSSSRPTTRSRLPARQDFRMLRAAAHRLIADVGLLALVPVLAA